MRTDTAGVPRAVWLWLMPVPIVAHIGARLVGGDGQFFARWIESESGIVENATALVLIPATVLALAAAKTAYRRFGAAACIWFAAVAFVCIGFAGEEVSWGQHWVGWSSPEYFAEHNRQGETNVHNLNIHLGRVVKSVLTLAIIVGGLILPLVWRRRERRLGAAPSLSDIVVPTVVCVLAAAVFVFGVRLVERFKTWFDLEWALLAVNLKESQELYIAIFLLVYAWSERSRIAASPG